jgi:hypothetical protein
MKAQKFAIGDLVRYKLRDYGWSKMKLRVIKINEDDTYLLQWEDGFLHHRSIPESDLIHESEYA